VRELISRESFELTIGQICFLPVNRYMKGANKDLPITLTKRCAWVSLSEFL